jgi:hypothetical protein
MYLLWFQDWTGSILLETELTVKIDINTWKTRAIWPKIWQKYYLLTGRYISSKTRKNSTLNTSSSSF